jgi:hypothetical protein
MSLPKENQEKRKRDWQPLGEVDAPAQILEENNLLWELMLLRFKYEHMNFRDAEQLEKERDRWFITGKAGELPAKRDLGVYDENGWGYAHITLEYLIQAAEAQRAIEAAQAQAREAQPQLEGIEENQVEEEEPEHAPALT